LETRGGPIGRIRSRKSHLTMSLASSMASASATRVAMSNRAALRAASASAASTSTHRVKPLALGDVHRRRVNRRRVSHVPAKAEGAEGADTAVPRKEEEPETAPDGWCDDGKGGACDDASASWDDDPVVDLEMRTGGDDDAPDAWWVSLMNEGLDTAPGWTLLAFFICDLGSALVLFAMYTAASVNVDADFVLAYALAKGPLRAPRLALDAIVAADMTRRWPQLARVKVTALIDAGTDALAAFKRFVNDKTGRGSHGSNAVASSANKNDGNETQTKETPGSKLATEARSLTDKYGLAYMAAKNLIGPVTMVIFYVALKAGVDVQSLLETALGASASGGAAAGAGAAAGRVCLSSFTSTALFPWVVLGAGALGPVLGKAARSVAKDTALSKAD